MMCPKYVQFDWGEMTDSGQPETLIFLTVNKSATILKVCLGSLSHGNFYLRGIYLQAQGKIWSFINILIHNYINVHEEEDAIMIQRLSSHY